MSEYKPTEYVVDFGDYRSNQFVRLNMALIEQNGAKLQERIVRCRDCKHFTPKGTHKFENGKVNADYCVYVRGWMLQITPDGFCAWGERRQP